MMTPEIDLSYDPATLAGPIDLNRVNAVEQSLAGMGCKRVKFDPSYLAHILQYHGGVPGKKYFRTPGGNEKVIVRFLNFANHHQDEIRGRHSITVVWSEMEDRLTDYLIPFATLFNGDMLCFDFEHGDRPSVVVWLHETSKEDKPDILLVARNFDQFLGMLYDQPENWNHENREHASFAVTPPILCPRCSAVLQICIKGVQEQTCRLCGARVSR